MSDILATEANLPGTVAEMRGALRQIYVAIVLDQMTLTEPAIKNGGERGLADWLNRAGDILFGEPQ